jgi:Flavoprotein
MGVPSPFSGGRWRSPARKTGAPSPCLDTGRWQHGAMRDGALSVIVCGSSASISVPAFLVWLKRDVDLDLRVLLTYSAERFVQRQVIAWHADELYTSDDPALNPAEFAKRARGIVVLPATANMLAAAALGLAATPAQTALLACEQPALFFPSMNSTMWEKGSVQRHVATLRADGHTVVPPAQREVFDMARRTTALGHVLPMPNDVVKAVLEWLDGSPPRREPDESPLTGCPDG